VCALAIFLERQGIATIVIGLTRLHIEKIRPPRALWVPFELGRPLGACVNGNDFQKNVLKRAFELLERNSGPVILEDFDQEDPGSIIDSSWRAPDLSGASSVATEIKLLLPLWEKKNARRKSMVGLSNLSIDQAADYLVRFDTDTPAVNPNDQMSNLLRMRFCADDIKAYYMEAALAKGTHASMQVGSWFWKETQAAATLIGIRRQNQQNEDVVRARVCNSLVPGAWH
jgi:hypothetical protein